MWGRGGSCWERDWRSGGGAGDEDDDDDDWGWTKKQKNKHLTRADIISRLIDK